MTQRAAGSRIPLTPVWAFLLGIGLYICNNLAIVSGWLHTPPGFAPMFLQRGADIAQYMTWIAGFQAAHLIPNYHAPWQTESAYFALLPWVIAQLATLMKGNVLLAYHLVHLIGHILAAYALLFTLRVFTYNRAQALATILILLASVPLLSLAVLPANMLRLLGIEWLPPLPGIGDFIWWSSDGFLHGIAGSVLVTYGTATVLATLGLLGLYLRTAQTRYLGYTCLLAFLSASFHPFEIIVIVGAGAGTLLLDRWTVNRRRGWVEAGLLATAGAAGLLPITLQMLTVPWLQEAAAVNRWQPSGPLRLLSILGLPTIVALAVLLRRHGSGLITVKTDALLRHWFIFTILVIWIPFLPWTQHLLDGFLYIVALLLVRLVATDSQLMAVLRRRRRLLGTALAALLLLSGSAYVAYYAATYADGARPTPQYAFSTVALADEGRLIAWLREHAEAEDLVLAPLQQAAWLATVPMHSLASHFVFSLSYAEQARLSDSFYAGEMAGEDARAFLDEYQPRYVVIPRGSPAENYVTGAQRAEVIGAFTIYRYADHKMQPYSLKTAASHD